MESLEQKVDSFDRELKKLWTFISDKSKKTDERLDKVEDKVESVDFSVGQMKDQVIQLEKERNSLKDEVVYLQSQSMRNNLVFTNI